MRHISAATIQEVMKQTIWFLSREHVGYLSYCLCIFSRHVFLYEYAKIQKSICVSLADKFNIVYLQPLSK